MSSVHPKFKFSIFDKGFQTYDQSEKFSQNPSILNGKFGEIAVHEPIRPHTLMTLLSDSHQKNQERARSATPYARIKRNPQIETSTYVNQPPTSIVIRPTISHFVRRSFSINQEKPESSANTERRESSVNIDKEDSQINGATLNSSINDMSLNSSAIEYSSTYRERPKKGINFKKSFYIDERTSTVPKYTRRNKVIEDILQAQNLLQEKPKLLNQIHNVRKLNLLKPNILIKQNKLADPGKNPYVHNDFHTGNTKNGYSRNLNGRFFYRQYW